MDTKTILRQRKIWEGVFCKYKQITESIVMCISKQIVSGKSAICEYLNFFYNFKNNTNICIISCVYSPCIGA